MKNESISSELYNRAKKAKNGVIVLLDHMDLNASPEEILKKVHDEFTPDEKLVMACGYLACSKEGIRFMNPTTARVVRYLSNGVESYEKGFAKITFVDHEKPAITAYEDHLMSVVSSRHYKWVPKEMAYDRNESDDEQAPDEE